MSFNVRAGKEATESELPALEQLVKLGYEYRANDVINQSRKKHGEVLLYDRLNAAIRRLNPDLDEEGVRGAMLQLAEEEYPYSLPPVDTNEKIRAKLISLSQTGGLNPVVVTQNSKEGPISKTVNIFDFDNIEKNDYIVTNQFKVQGHKNPIFLDIVVFVNGIPLVIIECKDPAINRPIEQAYEKNLARYQNPRSGFEKLFFYNHCMIATCGIRARVGTIQSDINRYAKWTDPYPHTKEQIEKNNNGKAREQEILIAGILSRQNLLNHLQNFVMYETVNQKMIKMIAKHQQYRVVTKSISRLQGTEDIKDKGGVIWHTQGSGKSLSMLWFASQLKRKLENPPILIVTDRKQLDKQIHNTFKSWGFTKPIRAKNSKHLKKLLSNPRGKTIMTIINKFQDDTEIYTKEKAICLVDEAHRTQFNVTAHRMRMAMPNAVFFGFTGTPIDEPNKNTYHVFGPMLDKYGFRESQFDHTTLQIMYEGRLPELFVEGNDTIDQIFERIIGQDPTVTPDMKKELRRRYVTTEKIAEAPSRIKRIASDIKEHYTKHIEPNGYKAMIVTHSREAAVLYKRELDKLNAPVSRIIMTSKLGEIGKDGQSWDKYHLSSSQLEQKSEEFKSANDPTKILIVVDMLLVGYDVPICQVLYLDKNLKKHNLLQAIARVNRKYDETKTRGFVVDYAGVTINLQKAFEKFNSQDIDGALYPIDDLLKELDEKHRKVMAYFDGLDINDYDSIIERFEFADKREKFEYDVKVFASFLDAVLPSRKAEPYIANFKDAGRARQVIRTYYDGVTPSLKPYAKKIQQLIDKHVRSSSISILITNKEITYENFLSFVLKDIKNDRAKAAIIKNRAVAVIRELASNNPAFYNDLRKQLQQIIDEEEQRRRDDANYFNRPESYTEIYNKAISEESARKKTFGEYNATRFEFALYGELCKERDEGESANITKKVYLDIKDETKLLEWKTRSGVKRNIRKLLYSILKNVGFGDDDIDRLSKIILTLLVNNHE